MSHRRGMKFAARMACVAGGTTAVALLIGLSGVGCDSTKKTTGTGGATGSGGATGTGGTTGTGGDDGTGGGGGGTTTACKDEKIVAPTEITTDTSWPCNSYVLKGITSIGNNATLTIAAGSTIYGDSADNTNPAALIAKRDGKLVAVGTADKPIVFTSSLPVGQRIPGDSLAGIVLLGKAGINNGTCQNDSNTATTACDAPGFLQSNIEGLAADDPRGQYGGADDTHNCGELKYVRVEFAGSLVGPDNELNGITVGACGSQTKLSYLHVHRGFDDGVELFGGTASVDHLLITGPTDDGLDFDNGWRGKAQFVIVHQGYTKGDKGIEGDNLGGAETSLPRTSPEIWNMTLIAENPSTKIGMHLREGARFKLRNFLVMNFGGGAVDVDAAMVMPAMEWPTNISIESSVFFNNPLSKDETTANNDMGFDEAAAIMDAARMNVTGMDPMLGSTAIGAPNYVPGATAVVSGKATPPAPLDTTATYAGAVKPGETAPWYAGWTAFPEN